MRLLLDTHTFLWFTSGHPALSAAARALLNDPMNERLLSIASPWEIAIKLNVGKLKLAKTVREFMDEQLATTQARLLPIALDHIATVATLPQHHRDPFDRLIISQAMVENIAIL